MKRIFSLVFLAVLTFAAYADNYKTVVVSDAPFRMEPTREFVFPDRSFPITKYGARSDGKTVNTLAIARAIRACSKAGGGHVVVPVGEWITGAVHFMDNVDLHLEKGAKLVFTDNPTDYLPAVHTTWEGVECYNYSPLVYAYKCRNIKISGEGQLAPRMNLWKKWFARPKAHIEATRQLYTWCSELYPMEKRRLTDIPESNMRPHLIQFNRCENVVLEDFSIRESPFWTIHMYMCNGGLVRRLNVYAHGHNNDGIDIDMTRNFLVEDCTFNQGDDAVVIKAGRNQDAWRLNSPTRNIVIRNCNVVDGHVLLGIGSEMSGGVENVWLHDCTCQGIIKECFYVKCNHRRGGFVRNIYLDNAKLKSARRLMAVDTDVVYQWKDFPDYDTVYTDISGLHIKNVECDSVNVGFDINGDPHSRIRNISIENISIGKMRDYFSRIVNADGVYMNNVSASATCNANIDNDVISGIPWYDTNGNIINSHGSGIIRDGGRYWLFGEYKSDTTNVFPGFGCYSSADLTHWRFERVVLPVQKDGIMGPGRVGERVKVMRCPKTGKYVMFMHSDDLKYGDPYTAIAVSDSVNGDYRFVGPLKYRGLPIRKWDIGTFQDYDGTGYLLAHHGPIYRLGDDYMSAVDMYLDEQLKNSGESPALFRKGGTYYMMYSDLTNWERNDNFYFTANDIRGPWKRQGNFCPNGSLTYNSQCTFVLPIVNGADTTFMYMGDRWSYPHQASSATQVWQPLTVDGEHVSIPEYMQSWSLKDFKKTDLDDVGTIISNRVWRSNVKGQSFSASECATRFMVYGHSDSHSGYGRVSIRNSKGKEVLNVIVDFYSKVQADGLLYMSPKLPKDTYTITVTVNGDYPVCYDKHGNRFCSDDSWVQIGRIVAL